MSTVKSAQRTLEVLELMERIREPVTISRLAQMLGYPQSSTSVLVNSLKDLGYLNFDPETREFAPSIRVALVGGYLRFGGSHAFEILDLISSVQRETGCTTILSTRNGVHAQYVYVLPAPGRGVEGLRAGSLRPLTRTAPGLVLLSECSDEEIGRIVRHVNVLPDTQKREKVPDVVKLASEVRERGYAVISDLLIKGIGSVAIRLPLDDSLGKALVISVAATSDHIRDHHADLASQMAREIAQLGKR